MGSERATNVRGAGPYCSHFASAKSEVDVLYSCTTPIGGRRRSTRSTLVSHSHTASLSSVWKKELISCFPSVWQCAPLCRFLRLWQMAIESWRAGDQRQALATVTVTQ